MSEPYVFTKVFPRIVDEIETSAVLSWGDKTHVVDHALWDTGGKKTCITQAIAQELGLIRLGEVRLDAMGHSEMRNLYYVNLRLECSNENNFTNFLVVDKPEIKDGYDMIIGIDVIKHGDFAISNYNGKTRFSFRIPSQKDISFMKEQREADIVEGKLMKIQGAQPVTQ